MYVGNKLVTSLSQSLVHHHYHGHHHCPLATAFIHINILHLLVHNLHLSNNH